MKIFKKKKYMVTAIILSILFLLGDAGVLFLSQKSFGRLPQGERLARIKQSPNYNGEQFVNLDTTVNLIYKKSKLQVWKEFLFDNSGVQIAPAKGDSLTVIRTDLKALPADKDWLVWFGHSSYLMNLSGKKVLVDPVLYAGSPVSFVNKMFKGTDVYKPKDFPFIDYLVISHDHWDHLDYEAVVELEPKVGKVITGLGVGEHFEYWGYPKEKLIELDWWEDSVLHQEKDVSGNDRIFKVISTPARHFSGRELHQNRTLWSSFYFKTPKRNVWISGDSGYGSHFKTIGEKFKDIDLAVLENGQYNPDWAFIHTMPKYLGQEMKELNANRYLTVHHSRFALSKHDYREPLENAKQAASESGKPVLMPQMGEVLYLE
ncbi:MAG: MBL fold metallo-hydrolase [Fibrobacter sp.]|nr:MBL fold metallo-hydrolase [Fibrobacter sp.]